MTREENFFYVFDSHLDEGKGWEVGEYDCYRCGYEFIYVIRSDMPIVCPRCTPSDRWAKRSAFPG